MYFDDDVPHRQVAALCSLSCSACATPFPTLASLQHHLRAQHKQHMCDVCLLGRKIFISQQVLYSKSGLERHLASGAADAGNALGEAGFKGHPRCAFCSLHFFGDGEQYTHMQREHFTCFLCQRVRPDSSSPVYYRGYGELEAHFRGEHCMCEHAGCLEKKFVAFASASELKRHCALEHGGELSKQAKREALSANELLNFSAPAGREGQWSAAGPRGARGGAGTRSSAMNAALTQIGLDATQLAAMRAQAAADAASAAAAAAARVNFADASAPTPAESSGWGAPPAGMSRSGSAGALDGGVTRWAAAAGGSGSLAGGGEDMFPSLPSISRNAARKQRAHERVQATPLVARLGAGPAMRVAAGAGAHAAPRRVVAPPPGARVSSSSQEEERWSQPVVRRPQAHAPPPPPPPLPPPPPPAAVPAGLHSSDALRAANGALVRRVMDLLPLVTRDEDFARFRHLSASFREGELPAGRYLAQLRAMGVASVLPELAALLPDEALRRELLSAAQQASQQQAPARPSPPAAFFAAAPPPPPPPCFAVRTPAWTCGACTLDNGSGTDLCSACGGQRRPGESEGASALSLALEAAMLRGGGRGGRAAARGAAGAPSEALGPPPRATQQSGGGHGGGSPAFPPLPAAPPRPPPLVNRGRGRPKPGNAWTQQTGDKLF